MYVYDATHLLRVPRFGIATNTRGIDIVGSKHASVKPSQDWIYKDVVEDYVARLRSGEKLRPIEVQRLPDGTEVILDGHHRYVASQLTGMPVDKVYSKSVYPVGEADWSDVVYSGERGLGRHRGN